MCISIVNKLRREGLYLNILAKLAKLAKLGVGEQVAKLIAKAFLFMIMMHCDFFFNCELSKNKLK